jgi:VCBS repeat-containing protein
MAVDDIASTNENTAITINVLSNDLPASIHKTLTTLSGAKSGKGAAIKIANGKVTYDPTNSTIIQALGQGEVITDTFTYTMTEQGNPYTATVFVTVTGVNDPPVISGTKSGQTAIDTSTINPFSTAVITDVDHSAQDSSTIKVLDSSGKATDANGFLSGVGLTKISEGTYTLDKAPPSTLTTEVENLTFTPTPHQGLAGSAITTNFSITVNDGIATVTDVKSSVVTTETAAPPTIASYNLSPITVPNTINIDSGLAADINDSGEVVGTYSLIVNGNLTQYGYTVINGNFSTVLAPGSVETEIFSVNSQGDYVGAYSLNSDPSDHAFVHHGDQFTNIPLPSGVFIEDIEINDKGQVAISTLGSGVAYIYDENTGILTPIPNPTGSSNMFINDINNNGIAVGALRIQQPNGSFVEHGFIYDTRNGAQSDFTIVPGKDTELTGINDDGDIIGNYFNSTTRQAFEAPHGDLNNIMDLFGDASRADAINNNDLIVGGDATGRLVVYGGSLTGDKTLDVTPNNSSVAASNLNNNNLMVGTGILGSGSTTELPILGTPVTA